jgi:tRNA nucleotidyltransferase (CCA-adding enzyme)
MHLILTHEQADFDAVGALLAARLLDPGATAVLPRRLNRNVRAFLTLYGDRLPLTAFEELPREAVERVTLVDTQSMPSVKGLARGAAVHVVDHHPLAADVDPGWSRLVEGVGATTTLLVETLEESAAQVGPIEATLLLTAIYEDTGSLTYAGTTARDARAVAWLLEQGASLTLAADSLHHPLTDGQRMVYDRLVEAAESLSIHGVSIVLACAEARGLEDEVSILVHKLRDLFDPAGLFVLVALDGHVQLVARSSSDSVDVARVSEHFGGGGHSRAAAALIRGQSLEQARAALLAYLPEVVRPAQTVADLMSNAPQLLDPSVPIGEAADRMRRFGHEGYPVVENGRVVGLLTRRAVDRAVAHGLVDRPVRTAMDPGDLVVYPDDSVERLQRTMVEHDWGQVPVVDRADGRVIGIVTRTDLLRSLVGPSTSQPAPALEAELERALPASRRALLRLVADAAEARRMALYVVGGFVRDLLLHQPGADFDLVVEGDAVAVALDLSQAFGGKVGSHRRFGTAKWRLDVDDPRLRQALSAGGADTVTALPKTLDFVSARAEFYTHPTALPSVQPGSIKLDLHRRDFSINTLAIRLDGAHYGRLLDPWGGGRDLRLGLIRALHSISFIDDPTRMLRAVRLEHRLGFQIEPRTLELLEQALPLLHRVSGERLRNELELIWDEPNMPAMMRRLETLGLLRAIHPELSWDGWLETRVDAARTFQAPDRWRLSASPAPDVLFLCLWAMRLQPDLAGTVGDRLRLPQSTIAAMRSAAQLWSDRASWDLRSPPSRRVRLLDLHPEAALVATCIALAEDDATRRSIDEYLGRLRFVHPRVDGDSLRALGLPPGPRFGRILSELREAWLDGEITSEADERRHLDRLLQIDGEAAVGLEPD